MLAKFDLFYLDFVLTCIFQINKKLIRETLSFSRYVIFFIIAESSLQSKSTVYLN